MNQVHNGVVMMAGALALGYFVYWLGLWHIGFFDQGGNDVDDVPDPGYEDVMNQCGYSWWSSNPIYVLKERHLKPGDEDFRDYECIGQDVMTWPQRYTKHGFVELSTSFRHIANTLVVSFAVERGWGHENDENDHLDLMVCKRSVKAALKEHGSSVHAHQSYCSSVCGCWSEERTHARKLRKSSVTRDHVSGLVFTGFLARSGDLASAHDKIDVTVAKSGADAAEVTAIISPPPPPSSHLASGLYVTWTMDNRLQLLEEKLKIALPKSLALRGEVHLSVGRPSQVRDEPVSQAQWDRRLS